MAKTEVGTDKSGHAALMWTTTVLWMIYKPLFSGPARMLIPEHTREAFFQLFCDLRTNNPMDRKWLNRHLRALTPRTLRGWVAVTAASLFASSMMAGVLCFLLSIAVVGFSAGLILLGVLGGIIAFAIGALAATMAVTSFCTVGSGCFFGAGYIFLSTVATILNYIGKLLAPPNPTPPQPGLLPGFAAGFPQGFPEPPRLPPGIDLSKLYSEPSFDSFSTSGYRHVQLQPVLGTGPRGAVSSPQNPLSNQANATDPNTPTPGTPAARQGDRRIGSPPDPVSARAAAAVPDDATSAGGETEFGDEELPASTPSDAAPPQNAMDAVNPPAPQTPQGSRQEADSGGSTPEQLPATSSGFGSRAADGNTDDTNTEGAPRTGNGHNGAGRAAAEETKLETTGADGAWRPPRAAEAVVPKAAVRTAANSTRAGLANNMPQHHRNGTIRAKAMGDAGETPFGPGDVVGNPWQPAEQLRGAPLRSGSGRAPHRRAARAAPSFASSFVL